MNENIAYLVDDVLVAAGYKLRDDDQWEELRDRLLAVLNVHYEVDIDAVEGDDSFVPDPEEEEYDSDSITVSEEEEEFSDSST